MKQTLASVALAALLACGHSPQPPSPAVHSTSASAAEKALGQSPAIPPLRPFDAPVPTVTTLPGGLRIYVVERPGDGVEAVEIVTRRGATSDPEGKGGLASLAAAMLEAGSAGKTQLQISERANLLGANLVVTAADDRLGVAASALPPQLDGMVQLLADVALRPNLDPAEWKRVREQRLAELAEQRAQPQVGATVAFETAVYANGPLGHPVEGTAASVARISLPDVRAFLRTFWPDESAVVAVGGAPAADVVAAVERAFGGCRAKGKTKPAPVQQPPGPGPRLVVVDYPGKPSSVVVVGQASVPRASPDYLALQLANSILGGSFTSRLNQNLRELHGYSYGAVSRFVFGSGAGPFAVLTSVQADATGAATREILAELQRIVSTPLAPAEVAKGKALLAYDLVESLEHAGRATATLSQIFLYGLPLDEYRTFVARLEALSPSDVQGAVARALQPATMTIAVAGDAKSAIPQLARDAGLTAVPQLRDPEGQPVRGRPPVVRSGGASGRP